MSERPILFNGEMVRAILDGRKTQTRRVVKLNHSGRVKQPGSARNWHLDDPDAVLACPYGMPGDRLWVREAFWTDGDEVIYRADPGAEKELDSAFTGLNWKPSIHMPRWASRINLEVTAVCVERLQDISRGDAMQEGCPFPNMQMGPDPREWFSDLWESINGPCGFGWDVNPLVWVVEFQKVGEA
jgi:hypothetical protein